MSRHSSSIYHDQSKSCVEWNAFLAHFDNHSLYSSFGIEAHWLFLLANLKSRLMKMSEIQLKTSFRKKIMRNARCLQATFLRNETEQNAWSLMNGKSRSLKIASGHSQMRFLHNKCAHAKQIIKIFEWNARFQVIAKWKIVHVGLNKEHVANNLTRWAKTEYNFVVQKSRTYN